MMNPAPASDLGRTGLVVGGKFRLDALIGRGAMGSVWSATHINLGHRLAIKLVAREFVQSPEALRRFDAEAKAAARLQSRHVVQVFDNGTLDDGTPYIAMELLTGENLDERIRRGGPVPLQEGATILAQACRALARAHGSGIVHRDIKPDNIFLARGLDEDGEVVKILDFGVAKITMALEGWTSSTGTGALLGTPLYMSPEQVQGSKSIDHRTDLYSLGMVAYTMLTGELAIEGETFGEVLLSICTRPLPSLRERVSSLPVAIETWFQRACAREAADRWQTPQEFIDSFQEVVVGAAEERRLTPGPATPPTLHSAGGPPSVQTFGAQPFGAQTASSVSVTAADIPRTRPVPLLAAMLLAGLLGLGVFAWMLLSAHARESMTTGSSSATDVLVAPSASALSGVSPAGPSTAPAPASADAASAASSVSAGTRAPPVPPAHPVMPPSTPPRPAASVTPAIPPVPAAAPPRAPARPKINLGY